MTNRANILRLLQMHRRRGTFSSIRRDMHAGLVVAQIDAEDGEGSGWVK